MRLADLSARQRANARVIFDAAVPFEQDAPGAVKAALMAAADESSFLRYANDGSYALDQAASIWRWYARTYGKDYPVLSTDRDIYRAHMRESLGFPYDKVAGSALTTKDSVGHFQQREMYGYGTIAQLMDPVESTRIFLRGVPGQPTKVRHWSRKDKKGADIAAQIQWVQGSEFPTGDNYRPLGQVADELIEAFGGLPTTKDGLAMAEVKDVTNAVKSEVSDRIDVLQAQVDQLKAWVQGGYDGSSKEQTNLAGIWRRADNVQQMLIGGYQGSTTTAKNNVDAIYWMLLNLCTALIPDVKHPDRAPNDQADPAPAGDAQP